MGPPPLSAGSNSSRCARCGAELPAQGEDCPNCGAADAPFQPRVIGRKYQLTQLIGRGGMGTVHLATDLSLERTCAVKMLRPSLASEEEVVQRFEKEGRVLARLEHPNVVPIYAVDREEGVPFIVMKYLEGKTFSQQRRDQGRPWTALELAPLVKQLCAGLGYMHSRGVVHRDLKPGNLFISPEGHLTILDLGIARTVDSTLTRPGLPLGTPHYMSPEQTSTTQIDARSDLYSVGVILFEAVTGRLPFLAESDFDLMRAHREEPPPDASALVPISARVGKLLQRAMAKAPLERYQTARELAEAWEVAATAPAPPVEPSRPIVGVRPAVETSRPATPVKPWLAEGEAAPAGQPQADEPFARTRMSAPALVAAEPGLESTEPSSRLRPAPAAGSRPLTPSRPSGSGSARPHRPTPSAPPVAKAAPLSSGLLGPRPPTPASRPVPQAGKGVTTDPLVPAVPSAPRPPGSSPSATHRDDPQTPIPPTKLRAQVPEATHLGGEEDGDRATAMVPSALVPSGVNHAPLPNGPGKTDAALQTLAGDEDDFGSDKTFVSSHDPSATLMGPEPGRLGPATTPHHPAVTPQHLAVTPQLAQSSPGDTMDNSSLSDGGQWGEPDKTVANPGRLHQAGAPPEAGPGAPWTALLRRASDKPLVLAVAGGVLFLLVGIALALLLGSPDEPTTSSIVEVKPGPPPAWKSDLPPDESPRGPAP